MRIEWTPRALRHRKHIFHFIAADNFAAAEVMDATISRAVKQISQFPLSGRKGIVEGTRECVFHKNYYFVYRVREECINILAVLHASQQWP